MPSLTTMTTTAGAELPFVALPQTQLLTVHDADMPWLENVLAEGVKFKPLRLDIEAGIWVLLVSFAPGSVVPLHYHTGEAEVYTLTGRWHYAEYAKQPQFSGSYLFEPAGSVHTLVVPDDNTEDTLMLVRVRGANVNFNQDGSFNSILDATALAFVSDLFCQQLAIEDLGYIRGGDTAFVTAGVGPQATMPEALAKTLNRG